MVRIKYIVSVLLMVLAVFYGKSHGFYPTLPYGSEYMGIGEIYVGDPWITGDPIKLRNYTTDIILRNIQIEWAYPFSGFYGTDDPYFNPKSIRKENYLSCNGEPRPADFNVKGGQEFDTSAHRRTCQGLSAPTVTDLSPGTTISVSYPYHDYSIHSFSAPVFYEAAYDHYCCTEWYYDPYGHPTLCKTSHVMLAKGTSITESVSIGGCINSGGFQVSGDHLLPASGEPWGCLLGMGCFSEDVGGWFSLWRSKSPLDVVLTIDREKVTNGQEVTLTLKYHNTGTADFFDVGMLYKGISSQMSMDDPMDDPPELPPFASVEVIDPEGGTVFPGGTIRWDIGTLPGGASGEIQFKVKINSDPEETRSWPFSHQAVIFGHQADPQAAAMKEVKAPFTLTPALSVEIKTLLKEVKPNETIDHSVSYENLSGRSFDNVVLIVPIPQYTAYVEGSAEQVGGVSPHYNSSQNRLEWHLGTVHSEVKGETTFQVKVDSCVPLEVLEIDARAEIWVGEQLYGKGTWSTLLKTIDLVLEVKEKNVRDGDVVHYTIKVTNLMSCPGPELALVDPVLHQEKGVLFEYADSGGTFDGSEVKWQLSSLSAGEEKVIHLNTRMPDPLPWDLWEVRNQAYIVISPWMKIQYSNEVKTSLGRYVVYGWVWDMKPSVTGNIPDHFFGTPLAGVVIELWKDEELINNTETMISDLDSNYSITAKEPGTYLVKARAETAMGELVLGKEVVFPEGEPQEIQVNFTIPMTLLELEVDLIKKLEEMEKHAIPLLSLFPKEVIPDPFNETLREMGLLHFSYDMFRAQRFLDYLKEYYDLFLEEDTVEWHRQNLARLVGAEMFLRRQYIDASGMADAFARQIALLVSMAQLLDRMKTPGKGAIAFLDNWGRQWKAYISNKFNIPVEALAGWDKKFADFVGTKGFKGGRIAFFTHLSWLYTWIFKEPDLQDPARDQYLFFKDLFFKSLRFLTGYFVNRLAGDIDFEITFQMIRTLLDWAMIGFYVKQTQEAVDDAGVKTGYEHEADFEGALGALDAFDQDLRNTTQAIQDGYNLLSTYVLSEVRATRGVVDILKFKPTEIPKFGEDLKDLKEVFKSGFKPGVQGAFRMTTLMVQLVAQGMATGFPFVQYLRLIGKAQEGVDIAFSQEKEGTRHQGMAGLASRSFEQASLKFPSGVRGTSGNPPELDQYATVLAQTLAALRSDPFGEGTNLLASLGEADSSLSVIFDPVAQRIAATPQGIVDDMALINAFQIHGEASTKRAVLYSDIITYLLDPAEEELSEIESHAASVLDANQRAYEALAGVEPMLHGIQTNPFLVIKSLDFPRSICPGLPIPVKARLENIGDQVAEGVEVELLPGDRVSLLSNAIHTIGSLAPHQSVEVNWQVKRVNLEGTYLQVHVRGSNVMDANETAWFIAESDDIDGDTMPNCWELAYGLDPYDASDGGLDPDRDGLKNVEEFQHSTNPLKADTDGDGIPDGVELAIGLDPTIPNVNILSSVADLSAFRTSSSSVSLSFTAPGYDGLGRASGYDLRYSDGPIAEDNWALAVEAWGEQQPLTAGSQESITVRGLEGNRAYCFALKSIDFEGKLSPLSTIACTKTSGLTDWNRKSDPVLSWGGPGDFDSNGVHQPYIIHDTTDPFYPDGIYKMWYAGATGEGADERYRIGYAVSPDGVQWTKVPGPGTGGSVLDLSTVDGFAETIIGNPNVIKDGATYKLWYYQQSGAGTPFSNAIVYCTSPDGINWTKHGGIFRRCRYECQGGCKAGCEEGRFDWSVAYFPSIMKDESETDPASRYKMWYSGLLSGVYSLGYAISPDGVNWTRVNGPNSNKSVLNKGSIADFDEVSPWTASVIRRNDQYFMFYTGYGLRSLTPSGSGIGGHVTTIGYATSQDGVHWNKVASSGTGGCSLDFGPSGSFDEGGGLEPVSFL